ncbi:MAG: T9SS type A sorting domain-containing protein [candidate division WOR-3 bacterium]
MKQSVIILFLFLCVLPQLVVVKSATIDVYMADPEVRIAQKLYVQISDVSPSDRLLVILDGDTVCDRNGPLLPEEIVLVSYANQVAGDHTLVVKIVDIYGNDASNIFTRTWRTLHNGIPVVGIDENNSIRVNGELYFPVYAPVERTSAQWIRDSLMNTTFTLDYRHPDRWDYTIDDYIDWLNITVGYGTRNIGPATRFQGIGRRIWINPETNDTVVIVNGHGHGNDLDIIRQYVIAVRDHPGLLMWQWSDEPDCGGTGNRAEPEEVRAWTDTCHKYDTNHPHAVNLGAYHYGRNDSYSVNLCREYSYVYGASTGHHSGERKPIADIIGFDFYPIEYGSMRDYSGLDVGFVSMADALDRLRFEYNHDLFPIFSWNENCDIHPEYTDAPACPGNRDYCPGFCSFDSTCNPSGTRCDKCCPEGSVRCTPGVNCPASTRGYCRNSPPYYQWTPPPTPEQMWAEYWIKIIHGVKGFQIHAAFSDDCVGYNSRTQGLPPRNAETMRKFLTWMNDLKYAVLGPDYDGTVIHQEASGVRVDVMVKKYEDIIYIIAANLSMEQSETVQFTMDVSSQGPVEVYGEGRTIPVSNNTFSDNFAPLGVHIYKYRASNDGSESNQPKQFYLYQNFPNPFNSSTKIQFFIGNREKIELIIYDILGKKVRTLVNDVLSTGAHTISWDGKDNFGNVVSSGIYFYQLRDGKNIVKTKKMTLIK